jgi:phage terminase large subunit-like protein
MRVSTVSPFISPDVWKSCAGPVLPFDGPVWCGLDLSARLDLSALVIVGQVDGVWQVQCHFWAPEIGLADRARRDRSPYGVWHRQGFLRTTPGASIDYEHVATDMAELLESLEVRAIAFDRWRIDVLKKELDRIGLDLPLEPFGQGFKDVSPALDTLEAELLNGRIAHGGNPVLTMCAANAVIVKDPANNRKLEKSRSTGRIDGLQALAMAMGVASKATEAQGIAFDSFTFV